MGIHQDAFAPAVKNSRLDSWPDDPVFAIRLARYAIGVERDVTVRDVCR